MRRCKPTLIGDVWKAFKQDNPDIAHKIREGSVGDVWKRVVGENVAATTQTNFVRGVLYVKVGPSVLRHELFLNREQLRHQMNQILGEEIVGVIIVK